MSIYQTLSDKLRNLSIADYIMTETIYTVIGLLVGSIYHTLLGLSFWFYMGLTVIAGLPLILELASYKGTLKECLKQYLNNNTPTRQALTFLCCFFFALTFACFFPVLVSFSWYIYVAIIIVMVIKPFYNIFIKN